MDRKLDEKKRVLYSALFSILWEIIWKRCVISKQNFLTFVKFFT